MPKIKGRSKTIIIEPKKLFDALDNTNGNITIAAKDLGVTQYIIAQNLKDFGGSKNVSRTYRRVRLIKILDTYYKTKDINATARYHKISASELLKILRKNNIKLGDWKHIETFLFTDKPNPDYQKTPIYFSVDRIRNKEVADSIIKFIKQNKGFGKKGEKEFGITKEYARQLLQQAGYKLEDKFTKRRFNLDINTFEEELVNNSGNITAIAKKYKVMIPTILSFTKKHNIDLDEFRTLVKYCKGLECINALIKTNGNWVKAAELMKKPYATIISIFLALDIKQQDISALFNNARHKYTTKEIFDLLDKKYRVRYGRTYILFNYLKNKNFDVKAVKKIYRAREFIKRAGMLIENKGDWQKTAEYFGISKHGLYIMFLKAGYKPADISGIIKIVDDKKFNWADVWNLFVKTEFDLIKTKTILETGDTRTLLYLTQPNIKIGNTY